MASYDFQQGLSGAASGAAAGSSFGPIGTAVGAGAGLLSGFFGGGSEASPARRRAIEENRERLRALIDKQKDAEERTATDTTFFQTGVSALEEQADRQATRDAQQAAARGLSGSQFEIAQDQNRTKSRAKALRGLLRTGSKVDRQKEQQLRSQVQRQRESLNALVSDQAQAQQRRSAQRGQALRQTFSNLPFLLDQADFGSGTGGGGTGEGDTGTVVPTQRGRFA